jgi:hypothetical protein
MTMSKSRERVIQHIINDSKANTLEEALKEWRFFAVQRNPMWQCCLNGANAKYTIYFQNTKTGKILLTGKLDAVTYFLPKDRYDLHRLLTPISQLEKNPNLPPDKKLVRYAHQRQLIGEDVAKALYALGKAAVLNKQEETRLRILNTALLMALSKEPEVPDITEEVFDLSLSYTPKEPTTIEKLISEDRVRVVNNVAVFDYTGWAANVNPQVFMEALTTTSPNTTPALAVVVLDNHRITRYKIIKLSEHPLDYKSISGLFSACERIANPRSLVCLDWSFDENSCLSSVFKSSLEVLDIVDVLSTYT